MLTRSCSCLCSAGASAQTYKPTEANLKTRQWFEDAKFGLFIHWGVYSVLGEGEWVMNNKKMTIAQYEAGSPRASIPPSSTPPPGSPSPRPPA